MHSGIAGQPLGAIVDGKLRMSLGVDLQLFCCSLEEGIDILLRICGITPHILSKLTLEAVRGGKQTDSLRHLRVDELISRIGNPLGMLRHTVGQVPDVLNCPTEDTTTEDMLCCHHGEFWIATLRIGKCFKRSISLSVVRENFLC